MSSLNTRPTVQISSQPSRNRSKSSGARRTRKISHRNFHQRPRQKEHPLEKHMRRANTTYNGRSTNQRNNFGKSARKADKGSKKNTDTNSNTKLKERPRKTLKVYRRKKVLRTWVLPALFFVPLGIIWLEYSIGKLIGLEDIRDAYEDQLVDPWNLLQQDLNTSRMRERGSIPELPKIAYAPRMQCPPGQRRMINVHNPESHSIGSDGRLIPMIVHQQSKTRCLTMKVDRATTKWAFQRWSYYIHDEISRGRLFDRYCGGGIPKCEFPLLSQIVTKCFNKQTNTQNHIRSYFLKIELWKFLTLWIFGGVYADLDVLPVKFTSTTIDRFDDGFLLIDSDTHMLSTKLIAVSPRHPIMYYAVQQMLLNILMEESSLSPVGRSTTVQKSTSNNTEYERRISGSSILSHAFRMFQEGYSIEGEHKKISPGVFHGVMNRTVRVVASGGLNIKTQTDGRGREDDSDKKKNDLVISIFKTENEKEVEYKKMGIAADSKEEFAVSEVENGVALSCRDKIYDFT